MAGSTGQQSGRSPRPMAGMYRPSIKEVSPPDGQYGMYRPTIWEVSRPMASMNWPTIRDVSPPNVRYVHQPLMYAGLPCTPWVPADNQWAHFWEAIGCPEFGVLGTVPRLTSNRTALGRPVGTVQEASKKHPVDGSKLD
ncbi:hypothetical protein PCANC_23177 [Puccinia coronata f. sp. avenae]|uniref:Uncharacterized protein n=1 Tax=Puccinia coronata f. sp. avenae TaxID=200324 RepID=A0A2N5U0C6_9BASI|nr:hypothetical protein PCANC_23177 [Puccinia coronata f. sp. avenae]